MMVTRSASLTLVAVDEAREDHSKKECNEEKSLYKTHFCCNTKRRKHRNALGSSTSTGPLVQVFCLLCAFFFLFWCVFFTSDPGWSVLPRYGPSLHLVAAAATPQNGCLINS